MCSAAFGQSAEARLSFDAADIQLSKTTGQEPTADFKPGGRVELRNATMKQMVYEA